MTESNDKNSLVKPEGEKQEAPRARNRTVMLSSDVTGEVRARLADDFTEEESATEARRILPSSEPIVDRGFSEPISAGTIVSSPTQSESKPVSAASSDEAQLEKARTTQAAPSAAFGTPTSKSPPAQPEAPKPAETPSHLRRTIPAPTPKPPVPSAPLASPGAAARGDRIEWSKESPVLGFLVSYDKDENGQVFELKGGRLIVTSEVSVGGSFLLLSDESVSPMHAILKAGTNGEVQVLDQLSESGTEIKRHDSGETESLSGDKGVLKHGDLVSFGDRSFHVCLIDRG